MSSYTKYHKTYYYKKMWMKEKAKMYAICERDPMRIENEFIYKFYGDFKLWLKYKGIDL